MKGKIVRVLFLFFGLLLFPIVVYSSCTYSINCKPYCSGHRRYTDADGKASCSYSECCTGYTCGEYGNECCGYSCPACGGSPCSPSCDFHPTGTDSDSDGYDAECDDCNDNNPLVNPDVSNHWCDCNPNNDGAYNSTVGVPENSDCKCVDTDPSGACTKFSAGCLCYDGQDNDCDGKIDLKDSDCPDVSKDLVIAQNVTWTENKNISPNDLYVLNGATFTIDGVTLTVGTTRVSGSGKIRFENGGELKCTDSP